MHSGTALTVLLATLTGVINCQTLNMGRCPTVDVKKDFDLTKYVGTWYENMKNRRYWFIMDSGLKCASETYTLDGDDTILVHNKGQRVLPIISRFVSVKGIGKLVSPGKFEFTFKDSTFSPENVPYWVLDTDYTNYAVVWSCSTRAGVNAQITWILTREIKPDPSVLRTAMDVLSRNGLGRASMIPTNHNSCKEES
ncbi:apolipoprotein D-like [Daphnia carinata]|uniref:apolipoprotein D-like n=1 Tax=Daphnia carinata TaxID=120202 RepID=UPI002580F77C|nr:apolipoprotein D-like [Daphnia carinata]